MSIYTKKRTQLVIGCQLKKVEIFDDDVHFSGGGNGALRNFSSYHLVTGEGHLITHKNRYKGKHPRRKARKSVILDYGGPVIITHRYKNPLPLDITTHTRKPGTGGTRQSYEGPMLISTSTAGVTFIAPPSPLSDSILTAIGVKAWAQAKPTSNRGGLAQALGELRDLPSNPVKFLKNAQANLRNIPHGNRGLILKNLTKSTAGQHLNIQFGILPLVKDISDLIKNVRDLQKNLAQLERDNGRPVRRTKHINGSSSTSSTTTTLSSLQVAALLEPAIATGFYPSGGTKTVTTTTEWDYRFSARFRYYIDWDKAHQGKIPQLLQLSRILLGLDLSVATLYELTPWSWLIDWFTNLGDLVSNVANDASDHLVADYAYVNGKHTTTTHTLITVELKNSGSDPVHRFESYDRQVAFHRIKATPYGFGLTMQQLNAKQLGILAALGITRVL